MGKVMSFKDRTSDLLAEGRAPYQVRAALAKAGGLNPYREPKYRMVRADCVREYHGGQWVDWPKNTNVQDQGGMVWSDRTVIRKHAILTGDPKIPVQLMTVEEPEGMVPSPTQPERVVCEMRYARKYPHIEGWILQRWYPASHYGSRVWWEAQVWPNTDLQILGPFPEHGAYEVLSWFDARGRGETNINIRSWTEVPGVSRLTAAVEYCESYRLEDEMSSDTRRLLRLKEYESRMLAENEQKRSEREMLIKEKLKPFISSSLEGGRLRGLLAARAGITSHVGN